jgi:hypothetical protein
VKGYWGFGIRDLGKRVGRLGEGEKRTTDEHGWTRMRKRGWDFGDFGFGTGGIRKGYWGFGI